MQNLHHDLGFVFIKNVPCGLPACSRSTPHYHCRICGFGTSQIANAATHSRMCSNMDSNQKEFITDSMYPSTTQPYSYYSTTQAPAPNTKIMAASQQSAAMFNFVIPPQSSQYSGLYGPQTAFANPSHFSPSNSYNFAQMDGSWVASSRLMSAAGSGVSETTNSAASSSCCRLEGSVGTEDKVNKEDNGHQNWNSQSSILPKFTDPITSSCSISLLFLEQTKENDECINVDDIYLTPKEEKCQTETAETTSEESDIIVEDTESETSDLTEDHMVACFVCEAKPSINHFTPITDNTPLTAASKSPVYEKVSAILDQKDCPKTSICSKCLDHVNTIDGLEVKLSLAIKELQTVFKTGKENIALKIDENLLCKVCDRSYSSASYLEKHHQHHTKVFSYFCEQCGKGFTNSQKLKNHADSLHSKNLQFQCDICGKQFLERISLKNHIRQHKGDLQHFCKICKKGFVQQKILKIHTHSHNNFFICHFCGRQISNYSNLQNHIKICSNNLKHDCDKCSKKYALKSLLEQHIKTEHELKFRYTCCTCQKGFWKHSDLAHHSLTHTQEKNFKCLACGNLYKSKKNLTHHMRIHDGPILRCSICGKQFTRSDALSDHMNSHTGRKPYECSVCRKKFANRINFNVHVKKHASNREGSKCLVCKKVLFGSLSEHMKIHSERKSFGCKFCPALFAFKNSLNKHLRAKHNDFKEAIS